MKTIFGIYGHSHSKRLINLCTIDWLPLVNLNPEKVWKYFGFYRTLCCSLYLLYLYDQEPRGSVGCRGTSDHHYHPRRARGHSTGELLTVLHSVILIVISLFVFFYIGLSMLFLYLWSPLFLVYWDRISPCIFLTPTAGTDVCTSYTCIAFTLPVFLHNNTLKDTWNIAWMEQIAAVYVMFIILKNKNHNWPWLFLAAWRNGIRSRPRVGGVLCLQ